MNNIKETTTFMTWYHIFRGIVMYVYISKISEYTPVLSDAQNLIHLYNPENITYNRLVKRTNKNISYTISFYFNFFVKTPNFIKKLLKLEINNVYDTRHFIVNINKLFYKLLRYLIIKLIKFNISRYIITLSKEGDTLLYNKTRHITKITGN